jgi:class 3 adenylate cyclase
MSFLETIETARAFLERNGRVSLRVLKREFELDDEALEELIEELVDIQQVAAREGKAIAWIGGTVQAGEAKLASSSPAPTPTPGAEAERRQLTVMFCDLVGSTDLSQRLDAEDLRNVVRSYQESASSVIDRYDGHIAQYLGDGLLVYFGYPQAHEDDAERAVRAGLEILTGLGTLNDTLEPQHGIRLAARVGIHTGPVVVGEMGGGAKSETLALGDTTNVAARLEVVAEPDSVVISGATLRLVPGIFATEDLGTPALKGIAEPIRAHAVLRATGVRSRLDVDPSRLTPLVGRDQEVGLLIERWRPTPRGVHSIR